MGVGVEADVVEDEELGFGAEVRRVGKTAVLEVEFGLLGDPAGIAIVVLPGDRVDDIGGHDQRRHFGERIHDSGRAVRNQKHVALIDRRPSADARSVDAEAFFEGIFRELADRVRDVLVQARQIGEAQVELTCVVGFREL